MFVKCSATKSFLSVSICFMRIVTYRVQPYIFLQISFEGLMAVRVPNKKEKSDTITLMFNLFYIKKLTQGARHILEGCTAHLQPFDKRFALK